MTPAQRERLKAFHAHQGHPGEPEGCGECDTQARRQRAVASELRRHQRALNERAAVLARAVDPRSKP